MINYDRRAAVEYARLWSLAANPIYYHFGGIGGDCTNFISQCLIAGGAVMNYKPNGWFYINSYSRSPSWTGVVQFYDFMTSNTGVGPFATPAEVGSLEIGDIIQLKQGMRFNHTLIISKITADEIYVCAHSNDALNKPLSSYFFNELRGLHIEGIRLA